MFPLLSVRGFELLGLTVDLGFQAITRPVGTPHLLPSPRRDEEWYPVGSARNQSRDCGADHLDPVVPGSVEVFANDHVSEGGFAGWQNGDWTIRPRNTASSKRIDV